MIAPTPRLTDLSIRALRPQSDRYEIPDPGARGLYVVVFPSGKKSYVCRFRVAGIHRKLTLQSGTSLATARLLAAKAMDQVAQGNDPCQQKLEAKLKAVNARANTFAAVVAEYTELEGGKLKSAKRREQYLTKTILPVLGRRQIDFIRRGEIMSLLDKIEKKSGACSADAVLQILTRIFNWHLLRNENFKSPIIAGMRRYSVADNIRERVLDDFEIRKIWTATEDGGCYEAFIRFLLLTGCRRTEAAAITFEEIKDGVWTLPASRSKTGTEIIRPLSKTALEIIESMPRLGPYVFGVAGRPLVAFSRYKTAFDTKCGFSNWRLHDVRRSSRTLLARAGVDDAVAERALGHTATRIVRTYNQHDYQNELRAAYEKLSALVSNITNPTDRVVPMRKRK